ncbi:hypothetical protein EYC80_002084 [Monilinia laxa]|uniref:Uncharacterized protein n=1 Tax=Monilinia laxa TaxID=61186 RepID=A0A5N6K2V1_MONLA|nr:hypothetical protein EYC80_002084 [Monilinia laxa]
MDNQGIDIDTRFGSGSKTRLSEKGFMKIPTHSSLSTLESENSSAGCITPASDDGSSQGISYRTILPKPHKNIGTGMEREFVEKSSLAVSQLEVMGEPLESDKLAMARTTRSGGELRSKTQDESEEVNESDEISEEDESSDFEHSDFDDANSHHDGQEPSISEPGSPTIEAPMPLEKTRRADTMFTKTELIALGVAYATEASWPRIAEYFPHRTQRSVYQTFKHTFTHAGNGHKLARDSYPPGADIPELRKKFQALRKLASRTRRVPTEELPDQYDQDIIRGHLSLSRWQKKGSKNGLKPKVESKKVVKERPLSTRQKHMHALAEAWEDEDDDSDFEDVETASTVIAKKESVKKENVKKEHIDTGGATIIKMEYDLTDQDKSAGLSKSSTMELNAPPQASNLSSVMSVRDLSELRNPPSEPSLEGKKTALIERLSQCENAEELHRVLMNLIETEELEEMGTRESEPRSKRKRL